MIKLEFDSIALRDEIETEQTAAGLFLAEEHNYTPTAGYLVFVDADELAARIPDPSGAIRDEGSSRLAGLVAPYAALERETWPTQRAEAEAYIADNAVAVPLISALAAARGITTADLAERIMGNVSAFQTAAGTILGEQQAKLDAAGE